MMSVLLFLVSVTVSAIDPLIMLGYVLAAVLPKTRMGVAAAGALAGTFFGGFSIVLANANYREPIFYSMLVQFTACVVWALALRTVIDAVRTKRASQKPETIEAPDVIERRRFARALTTMLLERGSACRR